MVKKICLSIVVLLLFFSCPFPVFAVSVSITNYPGTITDEPFTLTASISGASSGTNYLRIDIFRDQTSPNYFGETFNNTDWYSGSTHTQYLPITIQGGSWSGTVQGRIGSPTSSQYDGTGTYKIRLRRYTSGGGYTASEANNSAVVVSLALPTTTPTPTDDPPTATPKIPTPTKTPTPAKSSSSPTVKPSITKKPTPSPTKKVVKDTSVLGESTKSAEKKPTERPTPHVKAAKKDADIPLQAISTIIGGILLFACGILVYLKKNKF